MRDFISNHRRGVAIGAAALLLFAALSVGRCVAIHNLSSEGTSSSIGSSGSSSDDPSSTEEDEDDAELDAITLSLRGSYSDDKRDLIAYLAANTWAAEQETAFVTFTDRTFTESSPSDASSYAFVITAIDVPGGFWTAGTSGTDLTFAITTKDGSYIGRVRKDLATDGNPTVTLMCGAFSCTTGYMLASPASSLVIDGPSDNWYDVHETNQDALASALTDYAAANVPTATSASWDEIATEDYASGTVTLIFKLNNKAKSTVYVTFDMATRTFSASGKAA